MRRLSIILAVLVLLWPGHLPAGGIMINSFKYASSGSTGLCSSCTPGDPSDVFCEDFEGATDCGNDSGGASNCRCAWTSTETGTGSLSFASTRGQSTNPCAGKGTYNLDLYCGGTYESWSHEYSVTRSFSSTVTSYTNFYMRIESESLSDGERVFLLSLADPDNLVDIMSVALRQVGGVLYLATYANSEATGPNTGSTVITVGTWYRVSVEYVSNTASGGKVYINGVEDTTCRITTPNYSAQYIHLFAAAGTYRWQVDNIQQDNDTMPEACAQ